MIFRGTFEHALDAKHRLTVPSKFRAALAGRSPISPEARDLKRFFFNYSHDTELDSAHRVMIPPNLMDYASLGREVLVTGSGECLEVFDRARYAGYSDDVLSRVPEIAAKLGHTA